MVNEVLEKVKALTESHEAISKKCKALDKSNKAMNEELSRLQKDLENIYEEELQSLDSMELEEQIKFQESTDIVVSLDVDFCVKVDDVHLCIAHEGQVQSCSSFIVPSQPPLSVSKHETIIACPIQDQRILGR